MILPDTHAWVWWVNGDSALDAATLEFLTANEPSGLRVSIISCWEVAKKVEVGKLELDRDVGQWIQGALAYPGVRLLDLTPARLSGRQTCALTLRTGMEPTRPPKPRRAAAALAPM